MKSYEEKEAKSFPWIRAVRDEIYRDTKGMKPEELDAYFQARAEKTRKQSLLFTQEEAEGRTKAIPSSKAKAGRKPTPPRKAKTLAKPPAQRRKVAKRLAHA